MKKLLLATMIALASVTLVSAAEKTTKKAVAESTPKMTVEGYRQAIIQKNAAKVAEFIYMSKAQMEQLKKAGINSTVDLVKAIIKDLGEKDIADAKATTVVDEKITGNTAVVTIKNSKGQTETLHLIKIDNKWKLDFDKTTK